MNIYLSERKRRIVRLLVGVMLVPLACLAAVLFFTTSGPVPETFKSWKELGCSTRGEDVHSPVRYFEGVTECGRAYRVCNRENSSTLNSTDQTTLYDVWTNEQLGEVQIRDELKPGGLSQDKKLFFGPTNGELESGPLLGLWNLASGKLLKNLDQQKYQYCLNTPANVVLLRSENGGMVWDMASGKEKSSFQLSRRSHSFGYCDPEGQARCLTISKSIEIWNEETGSKRFDLANSEVSEDREGVLFRMSPDCRKVAIEEDGRILVWSLEDGSLVRSMPVVGSPFPVFLSDLFLKCGMSRVLFSNKSRWLVRVDELEPPAVFTPGIWTIVRWKISPTSFFGKHVATLVDLEGDGTEIKVPIQNGDTPLVAFSEDDSRMATFGNDGQYIWSVPPRTRVFTPWSWAALAACACLFVLWRKMGSMANRKLPLSS